MTSIYLLSWFKKLAYPDIYNFGATLFRNNEYTTRYDTGHQVWKSKWIEKNLVLKVRVRNLSNPFKNK